MYVLYIVYLERHGELILEVFGSNVDHMTRAAKHNDEVVCAGRILGVATQVS